MYISKLLSLAGLHAELGARGVKMKIFKMGGGGGGAMVQGSPSSIVGSQKSKGQNQSWGKAPSPSMQP